MTHVEQPAVFPEAKRVPRPRTIGSPFVAVTCRGADYAVGSTGSSPPCRRPALARSGEGGSAVDEVSEQCR